MSVAKQSQSVLSPSPAGPTTADEWFAARADDLIDCPLGCRMTKAACLARQRRYSTLTTYEVHLVDAPTKRPAPHMLRCSIQKCPHLIEDPWGEAQKHKAPEGAIMTVAQVAKWLAVSPRALLGLVSSRLGPPMTIDHRNRQVITLQELEAWLDGLVPDCGVYWVRQYLPHRRRNQANRRRKRSPKAQLSTH